MTTKAGATIEDLYSLPGNAKGEIVNGEIVLMSPTGDMPGRAGRYTLACAGTKV